MKELCGTHYDYCNVSDPELKSVYNDESSDLAAGDSDMLFVQYATLSRTSGAYKSQNRTTFCVLMCRAMEHFPEIVEWKSADIVPLFLRFFRYVDLSISSTASISLGNLDSFYTVQD